MDFNHRSVMVGTPAPGNSSECGWNPCAVFGIFSEKLNLNFVFQSSNDVEDPEVLIMYTPILPDNFTYVLPFDYYSSGFIVPNLVETDKSKYFILPFDPSLWIVILAGIFYFATICSTVSYISNGSRNFVSHIVSSFSVTICARGLGVTNSHMINGIHLLMIWYGIILTNLYSGYLGSYILAPMRKSVDTIIYNEGFKAIMETHHSDIFHSRFKVVGCPLDFYRDHISNANMTFGYFVNSVFWDNNFRSGKGATLKLFRKLGKFVKTNIVRSIIIRRGSIYTSYFEKMYLELWSHGFMKKFETYGDVINFPVNVNDSGGATSFNVDEITPIIKMLGLGLGCGVMMFLVELFFHKICSFK